MRSAALAGPHTSSAPGAEGEAVWLEDPGAAPLVPASGRCSTWHHPGGEGDQRLPEATPLLVFRRDSVGSLICWLALVSLAFSL